MHLDVGERFSKFVDASRGDDECHLWTGAKRPQGYGNFYFREAMQGAHRVAWWLASGEWPDDAYVLHRCHTPSCVNPLHLELGDHAENMRQRAEIGGFPNQQKTTCPRGHAYDGVNTYGYRTCRVCIRANERRRYSEKAVAA